MIYSKCIYSKEAWLLNKDGVNIIIALGHSGYDVDKQIAKNCPLVDVVIGGHSHSFLYSGQNHHSEKVEGPYPTTVIQESGKEVPVVQAYAFTKYMGELKLTVSLLFIYMNYVDFKSFIHFFSLIDMVILLDSMVAHCY